MATGRNVWLPAAGVWACLPLEEGGSSPKRRRGWSPSGADSEAGLGFRVERGEEEPGASSSHDAMCPICLGDIEEAGEAVLQWCMHRFCSHCIEEWSKVRRVCPLCKAEFRGWYHGVESNHEFQERVLPPLAEPSAQHPAATHRFRLWQHSRRQETGRGRRPRDHGVTPDESTTSSSSHAFGRSAPFPTQRSFGLPRQHQSAQTMRILEEQAAAKALQWRKSIYNRNLKARPFQIGRRSMVTKDARARAERRLEPWIRRELQAVLPNSDHAFLVRLVLGLWFGAEHESVHVVERQGRFSGQRTVTGSVEGAGEVEAIKELERFLGDKAELFWHELRCFAESPFTMQAYDTVVVYSREEDSRPPMNRTAGRSSHQDKSSLDSRRRSEPAAPRLTSRPLSNEEHGRQSCAAEGTFGQHRKDNLRDGVQTSQALLVRDSRRAEQRKKRSHVDAVPISEDRWQLSYC